MAVFAPQALVATLAGFDPVGRVWIAYSGGLDSTALLRAAAAVRERLPGALWAVHIDHGLHPDSARWGEHCRVTCEDLSIPLLTRRVTAKPGRGESPEAAARAARYGEFSSLLAPGDLLLTAHHQDDQAETLLLALIRGSGVHGLAAMPVVADLGLGRLVRPLLDYPRAALEQYARTLGLTWLDDPTNREPAMDRNYLRNLVLPLVRERWPAVSATLARSAAHCAEAADLVDLAAGRELAGLSGGRPGTLSIPGLVRLEPKLCKAVLRLWLRRRSFMVPDTTHLGRILAEVLPARPDADPLVAWRGCEIRRYRQDLFALRPSPPVSVGQTLAWAGAVLELPHGLGTLERVCDPGRRDAPLPPWRVRFGVSELSCRPAGGACNRPLKKLFQDAGVPPWLRPYVPLVFDGDDLVAVAGVCRCTAADAAAPEADAASAETPLTALPPLLPAVRWSGHPWELLGFFC
ncbi:tRNA lysidine(34) synthetase TilS [uncultured Thiodictyon sp.]|uniref:tRNA lysidine(34) synthetase TilS n=1 Tax=uncultured Thiodictyon sp. TaxID=1846217 RepID=UPI0025CBD12C|nr:tRNA lysidine(34) synthetase TilS [uncultured Thiodictyon sp.]